MYSTLTKQQWMDYLRLREHALPEGLIVLGRWGVGSAVATFGELAGRVTPIAHLENVVLAQSGGRQIALAVVYGAPMAADVCHVFCTLGIRLVVQLGWCGGLQSDFKYNELLVPTAVAGRDGVSRRYSSSTAQSTPHLQQALVDQCAARGFPHRAGTLVSTTNLAAESPRMVARWSQEGFTGVDLETAATFAVATKFGREHAALLSMADLVVEGHTMVQRPVGAAMPGDDDIRRQLEIALAVVDGQT